MHGEAESKFDVADQIVAFKRSMAPRREALKRAFGEVKDHVGHAADAIRNDAAAGRPVVPEVNHRDIRSGSVSEGMRQAIRRTGCAVVRGVFPASVASDWFAELDYASVIYIGSAPDCAKNRAYLAKQKSAFLAGRSAPDFTAMDFEDDFRGRATEKDLTELGRQQMGF